MSQPAPLTVSQSDDSQQHAGAQGANVRIEITEGIAKWLVLVTALMVLGSVIIAGFALMQAADARADANRIAGEARTAIATESGQIAVAIERVKTAEDDAARAQRQADLANWTLNNLEGIMTAHGIAVPENLQPHNLTRGTHK